MITNKVLDSVQQITAYSNALVYDADSCDFVDVKIASSELQRAVAKLNEEFDKDPGKNAYILTLKNEVDSKVLLLERLINAHTGKYKEKIVLREFAQTLYSDYMRRLREISEMKDLPESFIVEATAFSPFVIRLSVCAKQSCFELDGEDEKAIKKLTKVLEISNRGEK